MDFWGVGWMKIAEFQFWIKIKDQGFNVVGAFLKVPEYLIATRLVVEHFDNTSPFNIFTTGGGILQDLFCFVKVQKCFFNFVVFNEFFGFVVKTEDFFTELI